jgi:hypothetical protein
MAVEVATSTVLVIQALPTVGRDTSFIGP